VSKADGLNLAEIRETALGSLGGSKPPSIRKRGYHRALKRGEAWALNKKAFDQCIIDMNTEMYAKLVYEPNPFLGLSQWIPSAGDNFFGTDRNSIPVRYSHTYKKALWRRIYEMFGFTK
jgi:hypothetical protein